MSIAPASSPKKKRVKPPKEVAEQVFREFRHRCAKCGADRPQIHHIDEDPSNNDQLNLIPLCPNCHFQDIHDPTAPFDQGKLRLFRRFQNPFILDARFHPIWVRLERLRDLTKDVDLSGSSWEPACSDLGEFVKALEMGSYYGKRIRDLLQKLKTYADTVEPYERAIEQVQALCVEQLRYQRWQNDNLRSRSQLNRHQDPNGGG